MWYSIIHIHCFITIHWNDWCWNWSSNTFRPPDANSQLIGKDPDVGRDWRQEEKGTTEDEIVGWHHWLDGHSVSQSVSSVTQSCWTLCNPVNCSTPGLPVHHQLLEFIQTHVHQVHVHELPDVQAGFRKGRGTRDQVANIRWIIEKAREFQKNIYFCFIDYAKAFINP